MEGQKGRAGRPTTAPKEGEKATLGIRASAKLKARLDDAAKASARSLSQEAEIRLEASFRSEDLLSQVLRLAYGRQLAGLLMMIGRAMRPAGERSALDATYSHDAVDHWLDVPWAAEQATSAGMMVLEAFRPPPELRKFPEEIAGAPVRGGDRDHIERRGAILAEQVLRAIVERDAPTPDLDEFTAQVRPLLGDAQIRVPARHLTNGSKRGGDA
jgi:hypothetical protein